MAQTTVKLSEDLLYRVKEKGKESKTIHPGFIVSLALELWATDRWVPGPDVEALKGTQLFLELDDKAYEASLRKRMQTDAKISPIIRRALADWVDGRWEVALVRNHGS